MSFLLFLIFFSSFSKNEFKTDLNLEQSFKISQMSLKKMSTKILLARQLTQRQILKNLTKLKSGYSRLKYFRLFFFLIKVSSYF